MPAVAGEERDVPHVLPIGGPDARLLALLACTASAFAQSTWKEIEAAARKEDAALLYHDSRSASAERIVAVLIAAPRNEGQASNVGDIAAV